MKILRYILFPIVPIYYLVTWFRNALYNLGIKKSMSYEFPVICVGNLSVGGTGKTPMIELLIHLLKQDYKLATLSRGYKRSTEGFQLANENATAETIGDEPFQFYNKFKALVTVAVDSNRQHGIEKLRDLDETPDVILLDDAYQHRKVNAGLNIMLTTYASPFYNDIVLPTGDLREPRSGSNRANIIVVTKCPENLGENEKTEIVKRINPKSHQQVFFSSIVYSNILYSYNQTKTINDLDVFTLVTGIADATPLLSFLNNKELDFEHLNFQDHHKFTSEEIKVLSTKALIITTEKDYMRLKHYDALKDKLFYLPITVSMDKAAEFNALIKKNIKRY